MVTHLDNNNNNNNNKYISRAPNLSVSNQAEAQSAVHAQLELSKLHSQLKPSKQRNKRRQKKKTTTTKTNKQANKRKSRICWQTGKVQISNK